MTQLPTSLPAPLPAQTEFDWVKQDYGPVFLERAKRLEYIRRQPPEYLAGLKEFYKTNPVAFITDWGMTVDPRNAEVGKETTMPFVLFEKQREFIDWLYARWQAREDGLAEKSRDMGVSWLCVAFGAWMWLFHKDTVVGYGSRKEEYVDKLGDPKSLFWKVRMFINLLPVEFKPQGYDEKKHAPSMRIINPENNSAIVGEAGINIGRGNRASVYFKDEAQPLEAKILTPDGWSTMGEMRVGSRVIGQDGKAHNVIGVNDAGVHPVYRIGFSDGTSAECSPNHIWAVDKVWGAKKKLLMRTHEIAEKFKYNSPGGQTQYLYRVPSCLPIEFSPVNNHPLHPYVIGALLGDGCVSAKKRGSVSFTSADKQVLDEVSKFLPAGSFLNKSTKYDYRIVNRTGSGMTSRKQGPIFIDLLKESGIYGMVSYDKCVPHAYKFSSPENRLSLLQGLMDTDGSASGGVVSFHSASRQLAEDVRFLVQSLGGAASHLVKPDKRGFKDQHVIIIQMPLHLNPFRLERKKNKVIKRQPFGKKITSVDVLESKPVRCITIDSADGLYLTDHFIVTHNSAFYEQPELIDAALSQTSNCKIDVSTPNGNGNPFFRKRFSGKIPVFTFHYKSDPRKNEEWYRKQCEKINDPVIIAQELDIDYAASVANAWISADIVAAAQKIGPADVVAIGGWIVGVDAAHEGDDKSVITFRRGRLTLPQISEGKLDGIDLALLVENHCDDIVGHHGGDIAGIVIELDGPGVSAYDQLKRGRYASVVYGIHTGKKLLDHRHVNLRALLWGKAKEYLQDMPVCLPVDPEFKSQIASMKYFYKDGMLQMQDKKVYKKEYGRSPDNADSWILTHYEVRPKYSGSRGSPRGRVTANLGYANRKRSRR